MTDDRGQYRLFWLPAGQYVVSAAAGDPPDSPTPALPIRPGGTSSSAGDFARLAEVQLQALLRSEQGSRNTRLRILEDGTTQEEAWVPVYYPATTEARFATAVDVAAGTIRNGIDIVIGPARVQSVRGRAVGFTPGFTPTVTLVPQDTSGFRTPTAGTAASNVDGAFAFTGVVPGDYVIVARDLTGAAASPLPIHVGEGDVENLIIEMGQIVSLTGSIVIEGQTTDPGATHPRIGVLLRPDSLPTAYKATINTTVDPAAGSFVLRNLAPGDYQFQITTAVQSEGAKPLYVKSARLGLADVTGGLHIDTNTRDQLQIVLTTDSGAVEGAAIDSSGGPAANATVVLIPSVARKRFDLYQSVVTGADGHFRFPGLPPGDYKLFAWDDVETGAWQDPDFIRAFESKGQLVHIAGKSEQNVQLTVILTNP